MSYIKNRNATILHKVDMQVIHLGVAAQGVMLHNCKIIFL